MNRLDTIGKIAGAALLVLVTTEPVTLDRAHSTNLINTLSDAQTNPLKPFFAFETLTFRSIRRA